MSNRKQERKFKRRRSTDEVDHRIPEAEKDVACVDHAGKWIRTRSDNQFQFVQKIRENDLIVAIGPAGTGKTFLACALALQSYNEGKVARIVVTRPVVESGEKLGFLPGTLEEKIDPYIRPIYDSFYSLLGKDVTDRYLQERIIEIAPLAYMRGRTLENAFIILDEAQNSTEEQIELLLTRMGEGSKVVVTGDVTQVDLPKNRESGLMSLHEVVEGLKGVAFQSFTDVDVVRHPLVKELVKRYDTWKKKKAERKNK